MSAEQKKLLSFPSPPSGTVYVNDRVSFRTEGTERVISVHGVVFAHYDIGDRAAETYTDDHVVGIGIRESNRNRPIL